ncbi:hypothetical protein LJC58_04280 [Lachnospiraceae bacterium OttesenSCG-928-D06]|nr:hypothetical protein [Lachnospiraceae bacterium OttesenSCG-928-D06]
MKKYYQYIEKFIFPLILLIYPLRHIRFGVEWWDTGYNYGNFLFMDQMDPMWMFSTYLGTALGNLMTKLPFGNYMIGLNVYTGLLVSILALICYYFFIKMVKIPPVFAFLGQWMAISLCWCPTALLYNYLTYLFMGLAVICLYIALDREKKCFFVLAGICLAINVFVRFPNLAEMGFILAVWAYGFLQKRKIKEVVQQTLYCILGYVAGLLAGLIYISLRYGLKEYISALLRLFSMPQEASDYTIYSMLLGQIENYQYNFRWILYFLFFTILGIIGFLILSKKFLWIKKIGYVCCVWLSFYYLMMRNMFNLDYTTKMSVFQWAIFILSATLFMGIVQIFRKNVDNREKLIWGLCILIILITPLGSNNHLYSSVNNLFFVAPFTFYMLYLGLKSMKETIEIKGIKIHSFPIKAMIICISIMLMIQGTLFGFIYVFQESNGGENLNTKIENNDILRGMYTDEERAKVLTGLSTYVKKEGLRGKEVILYGYIPSLSYYLEMPFAITSWPDLRSYNYEVMEQDLNVILEEAGTKEGEYPIILLEKKYGDFLVDSENETIKEDAKFALLMSFIEQGEYEIDYENEKFVLLRVF